MSYKKRPWAPTTCSFLPLLAGLLYFVLCFGLDAAERNETSQRLMQEKESCIRNLKAIAAAVEAYRKDHHELPQWFTVLIPKYLPDVTTLMCPASKRTGRTEGPPLGDPGTPSSYLFEFSPVPLGNALPTEPNRTRREWRLRQMEMLGPGVPLVRCRQHQPHLNLAVDGRIFESPANWEELFTNKVSLSSLSPAGIFLHASNLIPPPNVPARAPGTARALLDLSQAYTATITEPWLNGNETGNSLSNLIVGVQKLGGIDFDIRGVLQLASRNTPPNRFSQRSREIPVRMRCKKLHFLHAATFGSPEDEAKQIASYVVSFVGQTARLEIPVVYGQDVRDWHWQPGEPAAHFNLRTVWHGDNQVSRRNGRPLRLFLTSWTNLLPHLEVESITCVSTMENPALFVLAITLEE